MQDLIQRKVDVIIVGATTADGVVPVVDEAKGKGIPIVAAGSIPSNKNLDSVILADHSGMGKLQGEFMGKQLNGQGKVLVMAGARRNQTGRSTGPTASKRRSRRSRHPDRGRAVDAHRPCHGPQADGGLAADLP